MDDKIIFHHFVVHYFVLQKSLLFAHIKPVEECLAGKFDESDTPIETKNGVQDPLPWGFALRSNFEKPSFLFG